MLKNNLEALRSHLFETIEKIRDEKNPMDVTGGVSASAYINLLSNAALQPTVVSHRGRVS